MKKTIALLTSVILLSGCKIDVETKVNTDDLLLLEHKIVSGLINIEVPACNDFNDSRNESSSLIQMKEKLPTIFKNIEYKECYKIGFNSYASFSVPVGVGYISDKPNPAIKFVDADIYVASTDDMYASVSLKKEAMKKLNSAKQSMPADFNLGMTVTLEKGQQPIPKVVALATYVINGKTYAPIAAKRILFKSNEIKFQLSDVSNSLIELGEKAPILVKQEYMDKMFADIK